MAVARMRPSHLRFTHDSVGNTFSDGNRLEDTFRELLYEECRVPPLVTMRYDNEWFVVRGNRRLYLLQKLEEVGKLTKVEVVIRKFDKQLFKRQFTSRNMGIVIRIRGDPLLEVRLSHLIENWRSVLNLRRRLYGESRTHPVDSLSSVRYEYADYSPPRSTHSVRSYTPPAQRTNWHQSG